MWFEGSPPSGCGKSSNPNGRPIEEIPCILPTLGPNHASRDAERAAFALSKKIPMTMCNAEKTRAVRAAILLAVCWRPFCASFLQLAKSNFEVRQQRVDPTVPIGVQCIGEF
jgi:hypothetical protein